MGQEKKVKGILNYDELAGLLMVITTYVIILAMYLTDFLENTTVPDFESRKEFARGFCTRLIALYIGYRGRGTKKIDAQDPSKIDYSANPFGKRPGFVRLVFGIVFAVTSIFIMIFKSTIPFTDIYFIGTLAITLFGTGGVAAWKPKE